MYRHLLHPEHICYLSNQTLIHILSIGLFARTMHSDLLNTSRIHPSKEYNPFHMYHSNQKNCTICNIHSNPGKIYKLHL